MTIDEQWDGPELPVYNRDHCMVKVNEDSILLTGGRSRVSNRYKILIELRRCRTGTL